MDKQTRLKQVTRCAYDQGADAAVARFADQLAQWDGDDVGMWVRVSSGEQDEANQVPDIVRHCIARNHRPAKWYVLHDKSAYKGEQQSKIDEMIEDMRDGVIKILVIWHSNRLERRGDAYMQVTLMAVHDAGGHVESTQESLFDTEGTEGELATAMSGIMAHRHSKDLSRSIRIGQDRIRANNGVITCLPWGYNPVGPKYAKTAEPTDECREYWPQILDRCIVGDSCRTIAVWLDSEGIKPTRGGYWNEDVLRRYIHNPVYCGRRLGWSKDAPLLKNEAVVSVDKWVKAVDALKNRPKQGPKTGRVNPKPMLAKLRCARCGSPMYRIHTDKHHPNDFNYRCAGQGPQRRGCGNIVPLVETELIIIVDIFTVSTKPYKARQWVEGKNWDAEIACIRQTIAKLDPESDEDEARRTELKARLRVYRRKNDEEGTTGHFEYKVVRKGDGSPMTEGEHFGRMLDNEGKREYLKTRDIRVEKVGKDGIRVVVDGEDLGVHVFNKLPEWYKA